MPPVDIIDAARAAKILQGRWEQDPLRLWQPHPKQAMFLSSRKSEAALLGANRSGKSDPMAALVASLARFGNPNPGTAYSTSPGGGKIEIIDRATSSWVVGLTEKLTREGIQPKIVTTAFTAAETHPAFVPPCEIAGWNINDQTWRLKNGSLITFKSADAGREVFQSAARDLIAFDEICDYEIYKESTLRVAGAGRKLMIRLAATLLPPLGMAGGVSWYFPEKIKPWWAKGNRENSLNNPDPWLDIFCMGMRDNPHIARDEIERLETIFIPGSMEWRIRVNGELLATIGGSRAYPAFNRQIHVDDRLRPESMLSHLPLNLCVDFNVSPCMWEVGQRIDSRWMFFDEICMDQCNIGTMVEEFRRRYPTHGAEVRVYGDQTGAIRNPQSGMSHYYLMQEAFRGYPVPVRQLLPTRNPPVVDRINAVNRALSGADGQVNLVMGPTCEELIADFEDVLLDPKGGLKKTHHMENPYYRRTHASDSVGYGVTYTDPVPHIVTVEHRLRSIPTPGYLGRGGNAGVMGRPPAGYNPEGRMRFGGSGGVLPPRR